MYYELLFFFNSVEFEIRPKILFSSHLYDYNHISILIYIFPSITLLIVMNCKRYHVYVGLTPKQTRNRVTVTLKYR